VSKEHCHALRVRLTEPVSPQTLADRLAVLEPSRLWVDEVPAAATDPIAERRRAAELARPAAGARCVLLRYTDGKADLVIVARRDRSVRRLAAALTGTALPAGPAQTGGPGQPTGPGQPPGLEPVHGDAPVPQWGLGDRRSMASETLHLSLPSGVDGTDVQGWQRALAATLHRYDGADGADSGPVADSGAAVGILFEPEPEPGPGPAGDDYVPCLAPTFPLTISIGHQPDGSQRLRCDFRRSHFSPAIVAQFARHLVHMYEHADLMSTVEGTRIAALGRPAPAPASAPTCLHEAFGRVAAAQPEAIALCDRDIRLTYRELDNRSDRLASGLRALGVGAGDRVGICLQRSAELVVTMLAVLKAGASYVPIDPAYPAERLAHTAQDAQLRVVVTRLPDLPRDREVRTVTPEELVADERTAPPGGPSSPDEPAYVIYTSGSAGRPKGVVIPHHNVISLLEATREEYQLGPDDVWTLFHSSAFDFSVWEIWGCLLTGGRLVVVPYLVSRDPERFGHLLVAEGVTVLSQTPSAFAQLLAAAPALRVRLVVFGGEPLDARMLLPWFDRYPEPACRMVNMFGITETTVHVTAQTLTRRHALAASRSVGPPLPGWHVYVMDSARRLEPPGVTGEIYVGGAGVALGYLNQAELTAQRFLPDPYAGGRMYRSGDRGRLLPDGTLEHLGRLDSQVKIRGFRIELDEIRAVLLEDPQVRAAAVVVRREDPDDAAAARIDAYVVLAGEDTASVRRRAAGILPEYMVPATVTAVSALPLTTNGKLDAAKLPAPAVSAVAKPGGRPTADDDLADTLTEVWAEVLGVTVGPDDDFFELGGNSLLAVRIGAAMRARGLPPLRLRDLFRNPTIRAVVSVADGQHPVERLADVWGYG